MGQAYFITGTGTDIGKTVVTSFLYKTLNQLGVKTMICKPFQTGYREDIQGYPDLHWFETELGVENSGIYQLKPETSPHLAIRLTQQEIDVQQILNRIQQLQKEFDVVLVEGAGGLAVPLIEQKTGFYMTKDLVIDAELPIIAVSPSGLGAIHDALTTFTYAQACQLNIQSIIFNRFNYTNEIHQDNVQTIEKLIAVSPLVCLPNFENIHTEMDSFIEKLLQNNHFVTQIQEVFNCVLHK
ncbi:dethiobiotin synthase [Peribacillus asahii]|uniref:dethiobiotin synthase n=1 Tax=Peribacillus asahii TaxID=228899 RepID=UPI0038056053